MVHKDATSENNQQGAIGQDLLEDAYWARDDVIIELADGRELILPAEELFRCNLCGLYGQKGGFEAHHIRYTASETLCIVCGDCHRRIHHDDGYHDDLQPENSRGWAKDNGFRLRGLRKARLEKPGEYEVYKLQRSRWLDA